MRPRWRSSSSTNTVTATIASALMVILLVGCGSSSSSSDARTSTTPATPEGTVVTFEVMAHGIDSDQTFRTTGGSGELRYGNGRLTGTSTLDGEPVAAELLAQVGYANGSGPFTGYWTFTASDGATLVFDYSGQATKQGDDTLISGELTVFGGSGRFAAVTGGGTVTGERRAALGGDVDYRFSLELRGLPG